MCGSLAVLCSAGHYKAIKASVIGRLARRGPDLTKEVTFPLKCGKQLYLLGTLLQMRGHSTPQPLSGSATPTKDAGEPDSLRKDYLLWNGNIFGGLQIGERGNDTLKLFEVLGRCRSSPESILSILSALHGPWAFVYWQNLSSHCAEGHQVVQPCTCKEYALQDYFPISQSSHYNILVASIDHVDHTLDYSAPFNVCVSQQVQMALKMQDCSHSMWFGRDVFGRRSLLWHLPVDADDPFCLSSVGHCGRDEMPLGYWKEVPAYGVYRLHYSMEESVLSGELTCYSWMQTGLCFQSVSILTEEPALHGTFLNVSIVKDERLQVPFPPLNKELPAELTKQGNVSSKAEAVVSVSPDTKTLGRTMDQLLPDAAESVPRQTQLLCSTNISEDNLKIISRKFLEVLEDAVWVRVKNAPWLPANRCAAEFGLDVGGEPGAAGLVGGEAGMTGLVVGEPGAAGLVGGEPGAAGLVGCEPGAAGLVGCEAGMTGLVGIETGPGGLVLGRARVAVLFSGGVDSAVMAALVDRCLPASEEIDLINVAFEENPSNLGQPSFQVPDRLSSLQCLKDLNPQRKWNLIMVDVMAQEVNDMRLEYVSQLIYPLRTVLDDSVGCALWFGARGRGWLYGSDQRRIYLSQARTLLVGIGADEQLGGYSRHRTKFKSEKWQGLLAELEKDTKRLAQRNLGRDDRCVADHHREGQFPFLDENVVSVLQGLPVWRKVDFSLPRGFGEKHLLREVALLLGCVSAARLPKRAIQFGSRIAKLSGTSGGREDGSGICSRLL